MYDENQILIYLDYIFIYIYIYIPTTIYYHWLYYLLLKWTSLIRFNIPGTTQTYPDTILKIWL